MNRVTTNRSVPVSTVLPHVYYQDLASAIRWLTTTFGFVEHYRYGSPVSGAKIHLRQAWIMVSQANPGATSPLYAGHRTQSLTVFVDDVDAHFERAKSAVRRIVEEVHETVYGERQYSAEDLEGHLWIFSEHARDLDPKEWGGDRRWPV
jgi:uncharacterized glyoxalase superfamily protein PhnB